MRARALRFGARTPPRAPRVGGGTWVRVEGSWVRGRVVCVDGMRPGRYVVRVGDRCLEAAADADGHLVARPACGAQNP